jgi:hypothetical protein
MLDQSLVRRQKKGDIFSVEYMQTTTISIPGFSYSGAPSSFVPCVCPGSRVWINGLNRFATVDELFKVQGLWLRLCFEQFSDKVKMKACGNAFSSSIASNLQALQTIVSSFISYNVNKAISMFSQYNV